MNATGASLPVSHTSRAIIEMLNRYQRVDESTASAQEDTCAPCVACFEARQAKIERFIRQGEAVHFVIPAFPAKSPNQKKVLGALPDLGELMALNFLQSMCDYVGFFHPPGARITICSDGHVFSDVVGVTDSAVTAYRESLMAGVKAANLVSLDMFGLDDAFGSQDYPKLREILERDYSVTLGELKENVRNDMAARSMFNGIHRFMYEDALARSGCEHTSKNKLRNESKDAAFQTIRRSNAWSRVVAEKFPEAIRLSIHPQPPHSEKFGIRLLPARDGWLTPWHGVVLDDGNSRYLAKRWDAEKLGASVVWRGGLPSHFVAPHLASNS